MKPTLLVLAAGMGSRYGGLKQLEPVGPAGELILDYSVFDAIQAGFGRVVFVIRRDFEAAFRDSVGARFEERIDVGYVFQQLNELPPGISVPEGRSKPWGTAHAIWCARAAVDTPFLAINADDFYGRPAFTAVSRFLSGTTAEATDYCMAGYPLASTLSANGPVSRGVCEVTEDGWLKTVTECTKIRAAGEVIVAADDGRVFTGREPVSMNCWGLTPRVFEGLEELFLHFLAWQASATDAEFYIPSAIATLIQTARARVKVLPVESQWFGVTYREDRPAILEGLQAMARSGEYPDPLWP